MKYKHIIGIDPGTEKSGFMLWDREKQIITAKDIPKNLILAKKLKFQQQLSETTICGIEDIQCQGQPLGKSIFRTLKWIGIFGYIEEQNKIVVIEIYRRTLVNHFTGSSTGGDRNISTALKIRFGNKGTKKNPGKLYGVKTHMWPALAVAIMINDYLELYGEDLGIEELRRKHEKKIRGYYNRNV